MKSLNKTRAALTALAFVCSGAAAVAEDAWYPFPVEVTHPPFEAQSPRTDQDYVALDKAEQKWRICVSIPHLKDDYWLAVNYGLASEARRLGVAMTLFEAGGYGNLEKQMAQIRECIAAGDNALIIGAISADGLTPLVSEIRAKDIPVIDLINGMNGTAMSAKSLVSFRDMGFQAGRYLVDKHGAQGGAAKVAWFPGPEGAAWVTAGDEGFREALAGSPLEIVASRHGDTGEAAQSQLINEVLDEIPDVAYIAGTAVTAEAAISILRKRKLNDQVGIVSYYFGPGVYRGIKRGKILGAPSDLPAIQARIAVDQAVRLLEKKPVLHHVGPKIAVVNAANLEKFDLTTTLAPKGFRVVFKVN
ncbi:TMAO reductase system periplasmic protein TorT [Magnetospira thiophila]